MKSKKEEMSYEDKLELRLLDIEVSLLKAFENTDQHIDLLKIKLISKDLHKNFIKTKTNDILEGLNNGAFGKYGIPFKINTIVFGSWIYKFKEEKQKLINRL